MHVGPSKHVWQKDVTDIWHDLENHPDEQAHCVQAPTLDESDDDDVVQAARVPCWTAPANPPAIACSLAWTKRRGVHPSRVCELTTGVRRSWAYR